MKKSQWETVARPGWFGEKRDELVREFNEKYGDGNWRIRHILGPRILGFDEAVHLYELSYELHFLNPHTRFLWMNLVKVAEDVWTEEESDVLSGTDYRIQTARASHYEDMAVRRILQRHGLTFTGKQLVRIRADSQDAVGIALSSIHVPFVFPQFIESGSEAHWWNRHPGSVEHFWHSNKMLQQKKGEL